MEAKQQNLPTEAFLTEPKVTTFLCVRRFSFLTTLFLCQQGKGFIRTA